MKAYMAYKKHTEQEQRLWGRALASSGVGVSPLPQPIPQSLDCLPVNSPLAV